jgi:hypothetical protein
MRFASGEACSDTPLSTIVKRTEFCTKTTSCLLRTTVVAALGSTEDR